MLIPYRQLHHAIVNFRARNHLMEDLHANNPNIDHGYHKLLLGFWLGSNVILPKLKISEHYKTQERFILTIYYCLLNFDKQISLIPESNIELRKYLQEQQFNLLHYLNKRCHLINTHPDEIIRHISVIIQKLDQTNSFHDDDFRFLSTLKNNCLDEIERLQKNDPSENWMSPTHKTSRHANELNYHENSLFTNLNILMNSIKSASVVRLFDHYTENIDTTRHTINKLIIPAEDGTLLEATYIKRNNAAPTKEVTLCLIGHFSAEDHYLADNQHSLYNLFDHDIVLVNHRNYSKHAAKVAENHDDFANDVIAIAKYFEKQKKRISLYGMCGGAPIMTLAAKKMHDEGKQVKLIIDRAFSQYSNFLSTKTIERAVSVIPVNEASIFKSQHPYLYRLCIGPLQHVMNLAWTVTQHQTNFRDMVRELPEENVMLLEAKSSRRKEHSEPLNLDIYIHPEDNMRMAFKDKRRQHKITLRKLVMICTELQDQSSELNLNLTSYFSNLITFFKNCINLIDDEKLQLSDKPERIEDIHTHHLFKLTTRNHLSINQFIQGFFTKHADTWMNSLSKFSPKEESAIYHSLQSHFWVYWETEPKFKHYS